MFSTKIMRTISTNINTNTFEITILYVIIDWYNKISDPIKETFIIFEKIRIKTPVLPLVCSLQLP